MNNDNKNNVGDDISADMEDGLFLEKYLKL